MQRSYPIVTMSPTDGIICPNDSVLLTCEVGLNYYWISPNGDSIGTTQSIQVHIPGLYSCIHTALDGCVQTSNFVEVKQYNTPYLTVTPGNVICTNGSAVISVQASNSAIIQWQPPLSGSDQSKIITAAGIYSCKITACGITTTDSVTITQSITPSIITATDSSICPGDTLTLNGNSGMDSYQWISQTSSDPFLYVTMPGTYVLRTSDIYGCYGFSVPFMVTALPQAVAPTVRDTSICAGQSISISASGPGPIAWYHSITGGTSFNVGTTYSTPIISNHTTYYLRTLDSICGSRIVPMNVSIYTSSTHPTFSGDTTLCIGDSLSLVANSSGLNYVWTGPGGISGTHQSIGVSSVSALDQGYYTLQYNDAMCISPVASFYVSVNPIPTPHISSDSMLYICTGTPTTLSIDSTYSSYSWLPGAQTNQSITVDSAGTYYATVIQNGCSGTSNSITVSLSNPLANPTTADVSACAGNSVTLTASGASELTWYNSSLHQVGTGTTYTISSADSNSIYFVKSVDTVGCSSQLVQVHVLVIQDSVAPIIYNSSPVCSGSTVFLSTDLVAGATYNWTGPGGFSSTQFAPVISAAQLSDTGSYHLVVSLNGCVSPPGLTSVIVKPIPLISISSINQFYCEQDTLHIEMPNALPGSSIQWTSPSGSNISDTNYINFSPLLLSDNGTYHLSIQNNGCSRDSAFAINIRPKPIAVANSNSPVCQNDTLQFYADSVLGATYSWIGPSGYISANQFNLFPHANSSLSGSYQLTVSLNGCTSDTAHITIQEVDLPIIDLGLDTAFCIGTSVVFTLPPQYTYLWNDSSTNDTYTAIDSGTVIVTASIGPGCKTTDSVHVDNYHCLSNVPNIITPNGDGINDNFYFKTEGMRAIDVTIYDRWGRLIYRWNDLNGYWNGKNLRDASVVVGVYFYVANITDFDYTSHEYKGFVHVQQ
jgi:gliding motility-associated-like protein